MIAQVGGIGAHDVYANGQRMMPGSGFAGQDAAAAGGSSLTNITDITDIHTILIIAFLLQNVVLVSAS